jgi:hypothetical protein
MTQSFVEILKEAEANKFITREELVSEFGLFTMSVHRWFSGESRPIEYIQHKVVEYIEKKKTQPKLGLS